MHQHYHALDSVHLTGSWVTIGVFDGVHRGHQEIVLKMTAGAHENAEPAVVVTFDPHPAAVLAGQEIQCLTTPDERAEIFFNLGVDVVVTMKFTRQLAEHTAYDFMADLKQHLDINRLLIGYDFSLGKNREGNFDRLTQIGRELEYQVNAVEPVTFNNIAISSTIIRQTIVTGDVRLAAEKLGRPYFATGMVVPGDGRGHTIGIPTANVDIPSTKAVPRNGVYACWAIVEEKKYQAVVNIGLRPTFTTSEVLPRVEAHLLNYGSDLYGKSVTLEFIERLRDEQKFASVQALIEQVQEDIQVAIGMLSPS